MEETFVNREYGPAQEAADEAVRDAAKDLEAVIALRLVPSREKSLAMTKLDECVMWASRALEVNGACIG